MCRSSKDECDLPEYCNGSSSFCQSDVFAQVRLKPRLLVDSSGEGLTGRWCLCFRTGSRAGTSRPTVTTGGVSTTTASVTPYLEPVGSPPAFTFTHSSSHMFFIMCPLCRLLCVLLLVIFRGAGGS